jgi:hypothetical protein
LKVIQFEDHVWSADDGWNIETDGFSSIARFGEVASCFFPGAEEIDETKPILGDKSRMIKGLAGIAANPTARSLRR